MQTYNQNNEISLEEKIALFKNTVGEDLLNNIKNYIKTSDLIILKNTIQKIKYNEIEYEIDDNIINIQDIGLLNYLKDIFLTINYYNNEHVKEQLHYILENSTLENLFNDMIQIDVQPIVNSIFSIYQDVQSFIKECNQYTNYAIEALHKVSAKCSTIDIKNEDLTPIMEIYEKIYNLCRNLDDILPENLEDQIKKFSIIHHNNCIEVYNIKYDIKNIEDLSKVLIQIITDKTIPTKQEISCDDLAHAINSQRTQFTKALETIKTVQQSIKFDLLENYKIEMHNIQPSINFNTTTKTNILIDGVVNKLTPIQKNPQRIEDFANTIQEVVSLYITNGDIIDMLDNEKNLTRFIKESNIDPIKQYIKKENSNPILDNIILYLKCIFFQKIFEKNIVSRKILENFFTFYNHHASEIDYSSRVYIKYIEDKMKKEEILCFEPKFRIIKDKLDKYHIHLTWRDDRIRPKFFINPATIDPTSILDIFLSNDKLKSQIFSMIKSNVDTICKIMQKFPTSRDILKQLCYNTDSEKMIIKNHNLRDYPQRILRKLISQNSSKIIERIGNSTYESFLQNQKFYYNNHSLEQNDLLQESNLLEICQVLISDNIMTIDFFLNNNESKILIEKYIFKQELKNLCVTIEENDKNNVILNGMLSLMLKDDTSKEILWNFIVRLYEELVNNAIYDSHNANCILKHHNGIHNTFINQVISQYLDIIKDPKISNINHQNYSDIITKSSKVITLINENDLKQSKITIFNSMIKQNVITQYKDLLEQYSKHRINFCNLIIEAFYKFLNIFGLCIGKTLNHSKEYLELGLQISKNPQIELTQKQKNLITRVEQYDSSWVKQNIPEDTLITSILPL